MPADNPTFPLYCASGAEVQLKPLNGPAHVHTPVPPDELRETFVRFLGSAAEGDVFDLGSAQPPGALHCLARQTACGSLFALVPAEADAGDPLQLLENPLARNLIDGLPAILLATDSRGCIRQANRAFEELSGYSLAEIRGRRPVDFVEMPEDETRFREFLQTLGSGESWRGILRIRPKGGGKTQHCQTHIDSLTDANGNCVGFIAISEDRTRREEVIRYLQQTQQMAVLSTLQHGIAHRFNNILASIMGHAELLQMVATRDPKISERAGKIVQAARNGRDFVAEMAEIGKAQDPRRRPIDLAPMLKELVQFISAATFSLIQIEADIPDRAPPVSGSASELKQVFLNLLIHAVQCAPEDRRHRIFIRLEALEPSDLRGAHVPSQIQIELSDDGALSAEDLRAAFGEESRPRPQAESGAVAVGLGLARETLERHNVSLAILASPSGGARVLLQFPVFADTGSLSRPCADQVQATGGQSGCVVVIDDDQQVLEANETLLRTLGYQTLAFRDPAEAIQYLGSHEHEGDLVLTDLTMPELDGLEVARRLRSVRPDLPVVLCTGYNNQTPTETLREAGIVDCLRKPSTASETMRMVERHVSHASA